MNSYYFGCHSKEDIGHFFFSPGMRRSKRHDVDELVPWGYGVDSKDFMDPQQIEGRAVLKRKDGWTALAFADRSADSRGNSKSVFLFDCLLDFHGALARAKEQFPEVFDRFAFAIQLDGSDERY